MKNLTDVQDSVLGPLVFIFSINDITNASDSLKIICYADDTTCLAQFNFQMQMAMHAINNSFETIMNYDLSKISECLQP